MHRKLLTVALVAALLLLAGCAGTGDTTNGTMTDEPGIGAETTTETPGATDDSPAQSTMTPTVTEPVGEETETESSGTDTPTSTDGGTETDAGTSTSTDTPDGNATG